MEVLSDKFWNSNVYWLAREAVYKSRIFLAMPSSLTSQIVWPVDKQPAITYIKDGK